jgi:hypothetical protein
MSLVEVVVAMSLMVAIVPVFVPLLISATKSARSLGFQSQTLDQLRLSVSTIGRELRSAECIYQPVANGPAGPTLRFRTNAFLTAAGTASYEVTYTAATGELRRQVTGQGSTIAAGGLVDPSGAFQQVFTPRRSVKLAFRVQTDPKDPVRDVATTIAGRNAWRDC